MSWKKELEGLEATKDWKAAVGLMQNTIRINPDDVEAYIRAIYLLLNILLEEDYTQVEHDTWAKLLKKYFDESLSKFSENAEYLFFIGYFIALAEWYFGQNDLRLADSMKKKASELEPNNILYEWGWRFADRDPLARLLAEKLLNSDKQRVKRLRSQGSPGRYILDVLERFYNNVSL